ncbi:MAG: site-specific DNA-methyltransferase [Proteobacteria bacterium]|nr:site-specific DNA-methyltransferase [Pseudomonadota bacterium]
METGHRIHFKNAAHMTDIDDAGVELVVTSPPYPMIEMWDPVFTRQNPRIEQPLLKGDGRKAFELMHSMLDQVWKETARVLKSGGFACINIGDATRTLDGEFALYPNHSRILHFFLNAGFTVLPSIIWRKQTNSPNKFMGSGMLPAGAYVTLEHEYILIMRKGPRRRIEDDEEKQRRRKSSIFWEERNNWYSDVWFDVKGASQVLNDRETRSRSAAYPFEIAYRLISMYSLKGDTVLDPFLGTGTTTAAAIASGRHSIGYEIDDTLTESILNSMNDIAEKSNRYMKIRIENHVAFVKERLDAGKPIKHFNSRHNFPVVTAQEKDILIGQVASFQIVDSGHFQATYSDGPIMTESTWETGDSGDDPERISHGTNETSREKTKKTGSDSGQFSLFN